MTHVDLETDVVPQPLGERGEDRRLDLVDAAAAPADQVDVLLFGRRMIGRRTVRQVRVGDQPDLFQQL